MRRAAKTDANHAQIVSVLRKCGCDVQSLAAVGDGVPDLLVHHRPTGRLALAEIKDGDLPPSRRRLTAAQREWHARWPVTVVETVEQALLLAERLSAGWLVVPQPSGRSETAK
jgi:hypothetical protein